MLYCVVHTAVWLIANLSIYTCANMLPFYVEYVVQPPLDKKGAWMSVYMLGMFGSSIPGIPFWSHIAKRYGKKEAFVMAWVCNILIVLSGVPIGKGGEVLFLVDCVLIGFSTAGWSLLFFSIQADVADYDELYTGMRREAQYVTLWSLIPKLVAVPCSSLPLTIMAYWGYVPNQHPQAHETQWVITTLFSIVPSICATVCLFFLLLFPINKANHEAIRQAIALHKQGLPARDPLNGRMVYPPEQASHQAELGWFLDNFSVYELRGALRHGPRWVLHRLLRNTALLVCILVALGVWLVKNAEEMEHAHLSFVLVTVLLLASFFFCVFLYQCARIHPAIKLCQLANADLCIQDHLPNIVHSHPQKTLTSPSAVNCS